MTRFRKGVIPRTRKERRPLWPLGSSFIGSRIRTSVMAKDLRMFTLSLNVRTVCLTFRGLRESFAEFFPRLPRIKFIVAGCTVLPSTVGTQSLPGAGRFRKENTPIGIRASVKRGHIAGSHNPSFQNRKPPVVRWWVFCCLLKYAESMIDYLILCAGRIVAITRRCKRRDLWSTGVRVPPGAQYED